MQGRHVWVPQACGQGRGAVQVPGAQASQAGSSHNGAASCEGHVAVCPPRKHHLSSLTVLYSTQASIAQRGWTDEACAGEPRENVGACIRKTAERGRAYQPKERAKSQPVPKGSAWKGPQRRRTTAKNVLLAYLLCYIIQVIPQSQYKPWYDLRFGDSPLACGCNLKQAMAQQ